MSEQQRLPPPSEGRGGSAATNTFLLLLPLSIFIVFSGLFRILSDQQAASVSSLVMSGTLCMSRTSP